MDDVVVLSKRDRTRGRLLRNLPKGGVVAEIGVWEGDFSARILEICQPKELHLIDPWLYQPEFPNTGFGKKKNATSMEERYHKVVARFAADPRVKVHRMTSDQGLAQFADGSFDWVYIDGNHNAPFIDQDLEAALLKVKADGLIAGDDYYWEAAEGVAPVRAAVDRLVTTGRSLQLMGNQYRIGLSSPLPA